MCMLELIINFSTIILDGSLLVSVTNAVEIALKIDYSHILLIISPYRIMLCVQYDAYSLISDTFEVMKCSRTVFRSNSLIEI